MKKRLKQVHEIVQSPEYQGQKINLHNDDEETSDSLSINSCDEDEESDSEPIMVFLDTITSEISIDSMSSYPNKNYATAWPEISVMATAHKRDYLAIWPPNTQRKCMAEIKQNKIEQVLAYREQVPRSGRVLESFLGYSD